MKWSVKNFLVLLMWSVLANYVSLESAASPCGTFEMVPMPGRALHVTAFEDGTATAIGSSADDPTIPVLRHFDGNAWSEHSLPTEVDGYAFGAAGSSPERRVCDFIASMTDRYAQDMYQRFFWPKSLA